MRQHDITSLDLLGLQKKADILYYRLTSHRKPKAGALIIETPGGPDLAFYQFQLIVPNICLYTQFDKL